MTWLARVLCWLGLFTAGMLLCIGMAAVLVAIGHDSEWED